MSILSLNCSYWRRPIFLENVMLISHVDTLGKRSSLQKNTAGSLSNPAAGNLLAPERNSRMSLSVIQPCLSVCVCVCVCACVCVCVCVTVCGWVMACVHIHNIVLVWCACATCKNMTMPSLRCARYRICCAMHEK